MTDDPFFNAVSEAWRATLPNNELNADCTLADAGMDSLKAMELMLRIEYALDRKMPYALLTAETTPRSLALDLARGACPMRSVDKPLLFFMTGMGGHVLDMVRSWQSVVEEMQLTLVDAPGLDRPHAVLADLSATAAEVAAEIARRQTEGDIRLMGYSYGAALAYEAARQLQVQGRRVAFLGLIDLLPVRGIFLRLMHALCSPAAVGRKLRGRLPRLDRKRQDRATQTLLIQAAIRFDAHGLASRLTRAKAEREGRDPAAADRLKIHGLRAQALRRWRPSPIEVPSLLIASDDGVLAGSPHFWRRRIPGLRVVRVPGQHHRLAADPINAHAVQLLREGLDLRC
jgi:thioesterase domain-containing protein/acyl carrier protein